MDLWVGNFFTLPVGTAAGFLKSKIFELCNPDASAVHACATGQLQANPPLVGPRLFPGKPTHRAVTTVCSNDLVVGEDHMLGLS